MTDKIFNNPQYESSVCFIWCNNMFYNLLTTLIIINFRIYTDREKETLGNTSIEIIHYCHGIIICQKAFFRAVVSIRIDDGRRKSKEKDVNETMERFGNIWKNNEIEEQKERERDRQTKTNRKSNMQKQK